MMTAEALKTYQLRVSGDGEVIGRVDDGPKYYAAADVQDAGERLDRIARRFRLENGVDYESALAFALEDRPDLAEVYAAFAT